MKIKSMRVQNFRSVKQIEIEAEQLNVIVGQNNHGKTNFFEAVNWFFNGFSRGIGKSNLIFSGASTSEEITVEVTFTGLQDAIQAMSNATKKQAMLRIFGEDEDEICIRRTTGFDSGKKRELQRPDTDDWENTMGADGTWNDLLPQIEYVHTKINVDDISGYKSKSPISEMLSGVLTAIIEEDPRYAELKDKFGDLFAGEESEVKAKLDELSGKVEIYLKKQFPDETKVKFSVEIPPFNDLLKGFSTEVDDGVLTSVGEKGDGMQRAVMLAIIQAYAEFRKENATARKFIFLIDEAELHLHPSAQRALLKALSDIADNGDQVFINTHSSVLITSEHQQKLFSVEKLEKKSIIKDIVHEDDRANIIFDLLGGSPTDLLLPKNIIIVEGRSEYEFINNIRRRFYPEHYKGIKIIFAKGDIDRQRELYHAIHEAYKPLMVDEGIYKNRVVILCDAPNSSNQAHFDNFKQVHSWLVEGEQLHVLPDDALEKYYPGDHKKDDSGIRELDENHTKVSYAKSVASAISQDDFESDMTVIYNALEKALELSFEAS